MRPNVKKKLANPKNQKVPFNIGDKKKLKSTSNGKLTKQKPKMGPSLPKSSKREKSLQSQSMKKSKKLELKCFPFEFVKPDVNKHQRSKTQNTLLNTGQFFQSRFYEDEDFLRPTFAEVQKNQSKIKRMKSIKTLKSQSSKKKIKVIQASKPKFQKRIHKEKRNACSYEVQNNKKCTSSFRQGKYATHRHDNNKEHIRQANEGINMLKQKFKSNRNKQKNNSYSKKGNSSFNNTKNLTLANLSQILQKSQQENLQLKSQKLLQSQWCQTRWQILGSIEEELNKFLESNDQENRQQDLNGQKLLFKQKKLISNFSTAVEALGAQQIEQTNPQHLRQSQINCNIRQHLYNLKILSLKRRQKFEGKNIQLSQRAPYINSQSLRVNFEQGSSPKTFRKKDAAKTLLLRGESDIVQQLIDEQQVLLDLMFKFHKVSQNHISKANIEKLNYERMVSELTQTYQRNQNKLVVKYKEVLQKNQQYQKMINFFKKNGVNVDQALSQ